MEESSSLRWWSKIISMSTKAEEEVDTCCASCGKAEVDDVKLKKCNGGCDLVKYCNNECQGNHREQHEDECKKRLAELRDRDLFKQPDGTDLGDCQICCLPLPIDPSKSTLMSCCSKYICNGCHYANRKREKEAGLKNRCPYCRESKTKSEEEGLKRIMERVKKNDAVALRFMGNIRLDKRDYNGAFEYLTSAAALGDALAHFDLSFLYAEGEGIEKDKDKEVYHLEEAAIGGHPPARHNLAVVELKNSRFERAKKHLIIAANLGCNESLQELRQLYADGHASKEEYADALRACQAAVVATKSSEREEAERYEKYHKFVAAVRRAELRTSSEGFVRET